MIKKINDDIIDDVLQSNRTFIILFYSEKLSNLTNLLKVFEEFDNKFKGKIDVYTCAIDEETGKLAQYFNMQILPGMIMMKNNKAYANVAGPVSSLTYEEAVKTGIIKIMNESKILSNSTFSSGYKTL